MTPRITPVWLLALALTLPEIVLAGSRAVEVTGNAAANGGVDIIVEDNDGPPHRTPTSSRSLRGVHNVSVQIPAESSAQNSANLLRDAFDEQLPPQYSAHVQRTTVVVSQPGEIIAFTIDDQVPGQSFEEVPPPPSDAPIGPAAIVVTVVALGVAGFLLVRRRDAAGSAPA